MAYQTPETEKNTKQKTNNWDAKTKSSDQAADTEGFQGMVLSKIAELGDLLERAGEKAEGKGFDKIGEAIYKLGDSLEHLKDKGFMKGFTDKKVSSKESAASNTSASVKDKSFNQDKSGAV